MLARYNRVANERIFAKCGELEDAEYRKQRAGSFGSIHALLNHILWGDRRWMGRFDNSGGEMPPFGSILYDDFAELRSARAREDARIEAFFESVTAAFWNRSFAYTTSDRKTYVEKTTVACAHMFNHQTHHRGQVHVMLSQTGIAPPPLDLHRIINP